MCGPNKSKSDGARSGLYGGWARTSKYSMNSCPCYTFRLQKKNGPLNLAFFGAESGAAIVNDTTATIKPRRNKAAQTWQQLNHECVIYTSKQYYPHKGKKHGE